MQLPDWADAEISKDLPVLRAKGENQDLEYMESFPQNVRELAKEIAAFATSNQGMILIGVSDSGDLIGLDSALTSDGRDELLRRVEGICRGTIKPAITPTVRFAIEDDKVVLMLLIPKGTQPIYYSNNIPYVRHITESRPAEPHEIIELVRLSLLAGNFEREKPSPLANLLSQLARIINGVLIYGEEVEERNVNPWLEMWRAQFQQAASDLRELAVQNVAIESNMSDELTELARALDEVANFRLYMGCWPEFLTLITRALDIARQIKKQRVDSIFISKGSLNEIEHTIISAARKLKNLVGRAEEMINYGRTEQFQAEASEVGHTLLQISYYNINSLKEGLSERLRTLGKALHLIETMRLYMDGGQSIAKIVDLVAKLSAELDEVAESLS